MRFYNLPDACAFYEGY